jgi:putative oxidoreductase
MDSRRLHVALWVAQGLLAIAFLVAGGLKLLAPSEPLTNGTGLSAELMRFIGVAEVSGALGVVLPAVLRVRPSLTALAALCLAVVMLLAMGFHAIRGEFSHIAAPLFLGSLAVFVAWGRGWRLPICPRSLATPQTGADRK